jgi:predicted DNA-binding antitoxin AbrB/MazE fold protein
MADTFEAVYEDGVLKPVRPLPLKEHERVRVTIVPGVPEVGPALEAARRSYGLLQWTGGPEVLRRIAEDDEFGLLGSP